MGDQWPVEAVLSEVTAICSNATAQDVVVGPVPNGQTWIVERVQAYDPDHTVTSLELIIVRGGLVFRLDRYVPAAAVYQYTFTGRAYVPEGCSVGVRFNAATSADYLRVTVNGRISR
jgi:hypothetical protein